jgi:hypothetical protein
MLILIFLNCKASEYTTGFYLSYGNTMMMKNQASTIGIKWDWTIKESISLGGEFHSYISDDNQTISEYFANEKPEYKINYGGLAIGKYLLYNETRRLSFSILFGSGGYHSWNHVVNQYNLENFLLIEPQLYFENNINNTFAYGINPAFKFVKDRPEMNHFSLRFYLKIGTF